MYPTSLFHVNALLNSSQYIGVVLEDRLNLYDTALEHRTLGINSVENGMMLRKDLHAGFRLGFCSFQKVCDSRHNFPIFAESSDF